MENPDGPAHDPGRGVYPHLAWKVANDPDIVVSEDEFDRQVLVQEFGEEVEHYPTQGRRRSDDRVLRVPRDHHRVRSGIASDRDEPFSEPVGRPLHRAERPLGSAAEAEMDVRDDDRSWLCAPRGFQQKRRSVRDGSHGALHDPTRAGSAPRAFLAGGGLALRESEPYAFIYKR